MLNERASGILLHVSSLPSRGGIGDLGPAACAFADFLAASEQQYWQVLPLNPTGYGNSPYSALSAFAGNPLFISIERLVEDGWLEHGCLDTAPPDHGPAQFDRACLWKLPLLGEAAQQFEKSADRAWQKRFDLFCHDNTFWLEDYASFNVLRKRFSGQSWPAWPQEFARRQPEALARLKSDDAGERMIEKIIQFFFQVQWESLRAYCGERKIRLIGDVAIFINYDSADVWTHPDIFELDNNCRAIHVAGVPPDYFSPTGQRWGLPLYRWDVLARRNFDWWDARIRRALALCDVLRLDHFRGFEAYWSIPAEDETAVRGRWIKALGTELFAHLHRELGDLPLIAEDLGTITPEVERMRRNFGLPGMRVMQFGFSDRGAHIHLPHRSEENMVIYTGTHDNDTTLGWWNTLSDPERGNVVTYLNPGDDGIVWAMMRSAAASVARLCLFPLQDILGLDSSARMNIPAESNGTNWAWRYSSDQLQSSIAEKLAALARVTDRDGFVEPVDPVSK